MDSFESEVRTPQGKHNLVLFHLMGQHIMAAERYPNDAFSYFTADSVRNNFPFINQQKREYIAHYDNATRYNDYILDRIISMFEDENTLLLYFSDHGDEVYDYRDRAGRQYGVLTSDLLKYQYDVPFMIWCSDTFQDKYPETVHKIKNAVKRPFMTDNVCNLLFGVAGVQTPYYRDTLDLLSPMYKCNERIINQKYRYEDIRYSLSE